MDIKTSFTDFFIQRPVFAWVVNIIVVLLGITTFFYLSTRQYPSTEGTRITVKVTMDGSTKVMEQQITKPLEDAFASLQGLENATSETQKGESKIHLWFDNRSLDAAASDVRDVLARTSLPSEADTNVTKGNADAVPVMDVVLTGDDVELSELYYIAENVLKSELESAPGVAMVDVGGGSNFQMDIVLDPLKMEAYQVSAAEAVTALKRHNFQKSVGRIMEKEREFQLTTQACLKTPQEFNNIVIANHGDKVIRLSDVGSASICPAEEIVKVVFNGKQAVSLEIRPQSNANPIDISNHIRQKITKISKTLPKGMKIWIAKDKAEFVKDSIFKVYQSLIEAVLLVLVVIFVFLRSFRASLIPLITIPISIIGTFFIMYCLGFTINVLTLLALVLAIGLVVDDAIVVLENIHRYIESGKSAFQAAILGTREIRFSIIAMTLTLAAVYAPIAVAPGMVGKVFKEFALTLAGSVLLSGFVALTLSPMMCARMLKSDHSVSNGWANNLSNKVGRVLAYFDYQYLRGIHFVFANKLPVLLSAFIFSTICGLIALYGIKKELSPKMDEGVLKFRFYQPSTKNLSYVAKRATQIDNLIHNIPEVSNRLLTLQTREPSYAQSVLKPWNQRNRSCADVAESLKKNLNDIRGMEGVAYCMNSSIIAKGEDPSKLSFNVLSSKSAEELQKVGRKIRSALKSFPGISNVDITEVAQEPEYEIKINRERISQFGIDPTEVADTLQTLVRGNITGQFEKDSKRYPVHIWVNEKSRHSIESISSLFVKGRKNQKEIMVPLREIITFEQKLSDPTINHTMKKRSYNIDASVSSGYGAAKVFLDFKKQVEKLLPPGYEIEPSDTLKQYFNEQGGIYLIFGLALLFIFLVMAAQFESFKAPLIILFSVPLALGGAIISLLFLKNGSLNVYSQIGLVTLIGLITKHGILLVDFANQLRISGKTTYEAIIQACQMRLRPILMTTFAMVLGAIPLAIATGAGAEARQQIGTVIVGGMTIGTLFTLFIVPIIYVLFIKDTNKTQPKL